MRAPIFATLILALPAVAFASGSSHTSSGGHSSGGGGHSSSSAPSSSGGGHSSGSAPSYGGGHSSGSAPSYGGGHSSGPSNFYGGSSGGHSVSPAPGYSSGPHGVSPAPGGYASYDSGGGYSGHRGGYYVSRGGYYAPYYGYYRPWYYGWGWGYGYYPMWPRPVYPHPVEEVERVTTELSGIGAANTLGGGAAGASLQLDGYSWGFNLDATGFFLGDQNGDLMAGGATPMSSGMFLGSMHLTYALLAGDSYRVRLEAGGSMLSLPSLADRDGALAFGPDVGVSARIGLLGPLGAEGHARLTPWPLATLDLEAALALRFGPLAVKGGWRDLRVATAPIDYAGTLRFSGPEVGLSLVF